MNRSDSEAVYRVAVLSVVKHSYVPNGVLSHPRFEPVVVADDPTEPDWVHERNELYAREIGVPYLRDVGAALVDYGAEVAVVSSAAERHVSLSLRAADAGLHIVQDKPMSTDLSECDRLVQAVEQANVKFLMWNRNFLPAVLRAQELMRSGEIGEPLAFHVDFYFSKDAGPPKGSRQPGDPPIKWIDRQIEAHADGSDGGVGVKPMGELEVEGIYPLAYIRLLAGADVQRVYARMASQFHQAHVDNEVDDLASVTLEMEGGLLGTICIGRIGADSHPEIGEIKIHVVGSEGGMVISESRPEVGIYYRGQPPAEYRHLRVANENDVLLAENFLRAIETGGDTILDARGSRAICATVHAAIRSGQSGAPVVVDCLD